MYVCGDVWVCGCVGVCVCGGVFLLAEMVWGESPSFPIPQTVHPLNCANHLGLSSRISSARKMVLASSLPLREG